MCLHLHEVQHFDIYLNSKYPGKQGFIPTKFWQINSDYLGMLCMYTQTNKKKGKGLLRIS